MPQFRKKPVVIEAMQWQPPKCVPAAPPWFRAAFRFDGAHNFTESSCLNIRTPNGAMRCVPGDWIIQCANGELYPCKPDVFAATYDPA